MEGRAPPVSPLSRPLNCRPLFPAPFRRPLTEHKRRVSFQDFLKFQTEPFFPPRLHQEPKESRYCREIFNHLFRAGGNWERYSL